MEVEAIHAETGTGGRGIVVKAMLRDGEQLLDARLPARETAALLPREYLTGEGGSLPASFFCTADEMLAKMVKGRRVRSWEYCGRVYFSFLQWRNITPQAAQTPACEEQ
jgi:hypothetical protein